MTAPPSLNRRIMFAMHPYPPVDGGSTVVMTNLLGSLPPDKVVVATVRHSGQQKVDADTPYPVYRVMRKMTFSSRAGHVASYLQIGSTARTIAKLVKRHKCDLVVGVYPNVFFLAAAHRAAQIAGVPFAPYLHDTVAEALSGRMFGTFAKRFQDRMFRDVDRFFVMSQGMADLYRRKYQLSPIPLVHSYPEAMPTEPPAEPGNGGGYWSGHIYAINQNAARRVYGAMRRREIGLTVSTGQNHEAVRNKGFDQGGVHFPPFMPRAELLALLRRQSFLILAMDRPEESAIHPDELGTIFPTKTIEYLAAGRPILLHCPQDYFLAQWCRQHNCAVVVSDTSDEALDAALHQVMTDEAGNRERCLNGYKAAAPFRADQVAATFIQGIQAI